MRRAFTRGSAMAALLAATWASAYVLPGGAIIRKMMELRDETHLFTLKIDGSATFMGSAAREAASALSLPLDRPEIQSDASLMLKLPGRCRLELSPVEGSKAAVAISAGKARVEGREITAVSRALEQVCDLLAVRSSSDSGAAATVSAHLQALKIDYHATTLARFSSQAADLQVAYVLGDPAEGKPQFWVYKESLLPARIEFADAQGTFWDIRFYDYASPATGDWFPRMLEVFRGTERVMRFTAVKSDTRSPLSDKLF